MAVDQCRERSLVSSGEKAVEEVAVRQTTHDPYAEEGMKMLDHSP